MVLLSSISSLACSLGQKRSQQEDEVGTTSTSQQNKGGVIRNFRQARGVPNVYRCAKTDHLSDCFGQHGYYCSAAEDLILREAGLVIDLRSEAERKPEKANKWTTQAPGGSFTVQYKTYHARAAMMKKESSKRVLLYLDALEPHQFMAHVEKCWFTPRQRKEAARYYYKTHDSKALRNLRMQVLQERGLVGLNQAILEIGKDALLEALMATTLHMEHYGTPIVINCVHGKDRTGILVMLIQSLLGLSDEQIQEDYHESEAPILGMVTKSMRGQPQSSDDEMRLQFFAAPKKVMRETLAYLRTEYGSVSPGYLEAIGFNFAWRNRLQTVLKARGRRALLLNQESSPIVYKRMHSHRVG